MCVREREGKGGMCGGVKREGGKEARRVGE